LPSITRNLSREATEAERIHNPRRLLSRQPSYCLGSRQFLKLRLIMKIIADIYWSIRLLIAMCQDEREAVKKERIENGDCSK
jgi:hypothetical protein